METVKLHVNYFKQSGKWYASGDVDVPYLAIKAVQFGSQEQVLELIDAHQKELSRGAYKEFIVVVTEPHYDNDPEYHDFFTRLYQPL